MKNELFVGGLLIYGCCILGANTKWQIGVAMFFIAGAVMLSARNK